VLLMETCADGTEYSSDFLVFADRVEILRITRKIRATDAPFGTIFAYHLSSAITKEIDCAQLTAILRQGARALGITHAVCMVDFMMSGQKITLLEMTPRPGGDCLPQLVRRACHFDAVLFALDVAQQRPSALEDRQYPDCVGLRLLTQIPGVLDYVDTSAVERDPRVLEIGLIRQSGHRILVPPDDYASWYLGYILFQPLAGIAVERQCEDIRQMVRVKIL
jgi:hypothetical protein